MSSPTPTNAILTSYSGTVATITINVPQKLNALNMHHYHQLACAMHDVAARPDIYVTVLTGRGRFFSAGADVGFVGSVQGEFADEREKWVKNFMAGNLHVRQPSSSFTIMIFLGCLKAGG